MSTTYLLPSDVVVLPKPSQSFRISPSNNQCPVSVPPASRPPDATEHYTFPIFLKHTFSTTSPQVATAWLFSCPTPPPPPYRSPTHLNAFQRPKHSTVLPQPYPKVQPPCNAPPSHRGTPNCLDSSLRALSSPLTRANLCPVSHHLTMQDRHLQSTTPATPPGVFPSTQVLGSMASWEAVRIQTSQGGQRRITEQIAKDWGGEGGGRQRWRWRGKTEERKRYQEKRGREKWQQTRDFTWS